MLSHLIFANNCEVDTIFHWIGEVLLFSRLKLWNHFGCSESFFNPRVTYIVETQFLYLYKCPHMSVRGGEKPVKLQWPRAQHNGGGWWGEAANTSRSLAERRPWVLDPSEACGRKWAWQPVSDSSARWRRRPAAKREAISGAHSRDNTSPVQILLHRLLRES